jgi:hypothetical protein
MTQPYLLEWLDAMVTLNLNPRRDNFKALTQQQSKEIMEKAVLETQLIQSRMTVQVFSLTKEKQIKVLIGNYHSSLVSLWDSLMLIEKTNDPEQNSHRKVISTLLCCLDELVNFMESRFEQFLSPDARMPALYAASVKKKLKKKIGLLSVSPQFQSSGKAASEIVFSELYRFANSSKNEKITFRDVLYRKQLVKKLESLKLNDRENTPYNDLDEVLIHLNFNSPLYLNYLTGLLSANVNEPGSLKEKRERLLLYSKELGQIYTNSTISLYKNYPDLNTLIHQWFEQELLFLEKKQQLVPQEDPAALKIENPAVPKPTVKGEDKVTCRLSTDQTALILRASQELNVLVSKSMNQLFKKIVPYLSTANKSNLSYDAMRSKAYSVEERDREIVIETLKKIIKCIEEY